MLQEKEENQLKFPLWQYLKQPIFHSQIPFILNPRHFAYNWRVKLLEKCLKKECDAKGQQPS